MPFYFLSYKILVLSITMLEDKIIFKKYKEKVTEDILNLFDLWVNKLVDYQPEAYFSATTSRNMH